MEEILIQPDFKIIPWLQQNYQTLIARYSEKTPPHALMIYGKAGIGKVRLTDALIAGILCRTLQGNMPCGTCQSCRWLATYFHPDLYEIKGEGEIKVDEIRKIHQFAQLTPETGKKIVVIKHADRMNLNAANSLLKVLEEPPADLFFILESSAIEKLPITVRSRCQSYFVEAPKRDVALDYLRKMPSNAALSELDLSFLLSLSFDAPFVAEDYLQSGYLEKRGPLLGVINALWQGEVNPSKGVATLLETESLSFNLLFFLLSTSFNPVKVAELSALSEIFITLHNIPEKTRLTQYEKLVEINRLRQAQTRTDWALEAWFVEFLG